jgi:hypothetical protein
MKHYRSIAIAVVVTIAILAALWLRWPHHQEPNESPLPNETNLVATAQTSVATRTSAPSRAAMSANLSNVEHVAEAYKQGLINKGEAMVAMEQVANSQPQEMYGRVIDQYGQPVAGAAVTGTVMFQAGWNASREEPHAAQTDGNGEFQFTGLHGWKLAVAPSKPGYELGRNITAMLLPASGKTSPSDRAIFTMWKLKGPEPMTHANIHAYIPCDGTITRYDLLTGKRSAQGDLVVSLTRKPVNIDRGKPFDWSVTLEVPGGGLQEITDLYPNEAPQNGYGKESTTHFSLDMPKWEAAWRQSFYFQGRGGQVHGRMVVTIQAEFQPPPTFFSAEIYANPSGSRNLEFDPAKQIR